MSGLLGNTDAEQQEGRLNARWNDIPSNEASGSSAVAAAGGGSNDGGGGSVGHKIQKPFHTCAHAKVTTSAVEHEQAARGLFEVIFILSLSTHSHSLHDD